MSLTELIARGAVLGGIFLVVFLVVALIRAAFRLLTRMFSPRSLGRASAVVENKARSAIKSFQDGRGSGL